MTRRVIAVLIAVVLAAIGAGAVLLYVRSADARALEGKEARTVLVADKADPGRHDGRRAARRQVRARGPDAGGDPARGRADRDRSPPTRRW